MDPISQHGQDDIGPSESSPLSTATPLPANNSSGFQPLSCRSPAHPRRRAVELVRFRDQTLPGPPSIEHWPSAFFWGSKTGQRASRMTFPNEKPIGKLECWATAFLYSGPIVCDSNSSVCAHSSAQTIGRPPRVRAPLFVDHQD